MTTITLPRATVEQALEALRSIVVCLRSRNGTPVSVALDEDKCAASITALRAALKQEAKDQDPELSAALGWPGGISNPVLDRVQLLQMVAALRVSSRQAQTCVWRDNLDAIYETACGNLHIVNDGTLEENGMKYCCYCGKEVKDESPT